MKDDFLKDYIKVNDRIIKFYEKYPEGSIQTEIISVDSEKVLMKANVYKNSNDIVPCTGHAEEIRSSSYVNRSSAVENCETSAVGRALANLGFEISHSVASREEVESAINKLEFQKQETLANNKEKKDLFNVVKQKGISENKFKVICESITNKESSKEWTITDLNKINNYINSIDIH